MLVSTYLCIKKVKIRTAAIVLVTVNEMAIKPQLMCILYGIPAKTPARENRSQAWSLKPQSWKIPVFTGSACFCLLVLITVYCGIRKNWEVRRVSWVPESPLCSCCVTPMPWSSGSIHSRVIPFFSCWFSGIRSLKRRVAVSSSDSVEPWLHPLVEAFLS